MWFNPLSVWTQAPIGSRTVKTRKSKVTGTIALTNGGANSATATIASADTTYTDLSYLGLTTTDPALAAVQLVETNATTITASRNNSGNAADVTVSYQRLEGYGA